MILNNMTSEERTIDIPSSTISAFKTFASQGSQFALPLQLTANSIQCLPPVLFPDDTSASFQTTLSQLESHITTKTALYLIVRHNNSLTFITYIPYLAESSSTQIYLANRQVVLTHLGETNFTSSFICKEPGAITDERAWKERDGEGQPWNPPNADQCKTGDASAEKHVQDHGHQKTKCRLCDRRMKNPITADALAALKGLKNGEAGACVQLTVDPKTLSLTLLSPCTPIPPTSLPALISTPTPNYTFYLHAHPSGSNPSPSSPSPSSPSSSPSNTSPPTLYFIFFSPDSAPVKQRMIHTMAVPGLVNVICKEVGLRVDEKRELHEVGDVADLRFDVVEGRGGVGEGRKRGEKAEGGDRVEESEQGEEEEEGDNRVEEGEDGGEKDGSGKEKGKYRSMFLWKNGQRGTESVWAGMEKA
ncbi:hypothetical protein K491DRAFT_782864 [Lophiostoma macrostomum CBS 122681]|uniref:ADF-H domain-containing protein n=1 Tax=Lophiostoma macrostomum CBS 122681 TaxID=1314788 RepID=A0A6A6SV54_9PLEO|nr:hypothetical protein K491DRAFT_782864 [Lophiostoma macrostomum CBS 122681]